MGPLHTLWSVLCVMSARSHRDDRHANLADGVKSFPLPAFGNRSGASDVSRWVIRTGCDAGDNAKNLDRGAHETCNTDPVRAFGGAGPGGLVREASDGDG